MSCTARRLRNRGALPLGCALAALWATPAWADGGLQLFTPGTLEVCGDLRLVAVDGERSWVDGGFGKLRSGSDGEFKLQPQLGNAILVWKPQFSWTVGAVVVGEVEGGQRTDAGLSQAYLTYRAMRGSKLGFSARAGLMWPPVSLEHEGADWHVKDSITPSAINSWIGEEVRPVAAEATVTAQLGRNKLRATAAVMAANDTAGTLLTFRGWALHDRTTLAFRPQPLPPFDGPIAFIQAPLTHPLVDLAHGFASRPGYYAKLSWQPPVPLRIELFRYDNRADPEVVNDGSEWGWRTAFTDVGAVAELGSGAELKVQALQGWTRMGYPNPLKRWVDGRFRAAYALLSKRVGTVLLTGRVDAFGTRNRGSDVGPEYDDSGWSAMLAAKRDWPHFTGLLELLHVSSKRADRDEVGLAPQQEQTQLQAEVRMHW
jgi:hypothetical protein